MNQNEFIEEDEIDLKELLHTLIKHKFKIIFTALLFTLGAAVYAYLQPDIYQATTTLELKSESSSKPSSEDMLSLALDGGSQVNPDTEIAKIQSRTNMLAALQNVDLAHRYYIENLYKKYELYNDSPFTVLLGEGENTLFTIYPVDKTHYRIEAKVIDPKTKESVKVDKLASYGVNAKGPGYDFTLNLKEGQQLEAGKKYHFIVYDTFTLLEEVQKNLSVSQLGKRSDIIQINYNDEVPMRAKEYADALAEAYLAQEIEIKNKEASKILAFIDLQLSGVDKKLKSSESKLENFKKKSSMVNLGSKSTTVIDNLTELETKLSDVTMAEELLSSLYNQIRSGKNLESITAAGLNIEETGIPKLIQEMQKAVLQRKLLLQDYTYAHPEVKRLTQSINQQKRIIATSIEALKKRISERKRLLQKKLKDAEKRMESLPEEEKVLGGLQRKFVINEKIYSYLLQKRAETAIQKASTVTKTRIIDRAVEPIKPIKPKRKLIIIVGFITGLILGIFIAFLREFLDDRIHNEEELKKLSNLPVVGTIPFIKKDKDSIKVFKSPKSVVTEAYRALRSNLQFMGSSEQLVISLTSTIAGEGKTTTAVNLAAIISLTGKKVIIINADMRKPTLHDKFNLPNNEGLSSLLAGKA
ncbi:MAG TPA: capsular biosynthesis protein, partial [Nitratifractor sp.]|nr:capsular biosynthesis protein [Nitratifractor sp.]